VIVTGLSALFVPAALAKVGVVARLTTPLMTAPSGGVPVEFTLTGEDGRPFSAQDIFARVRTTDGRVLEIWPDERGTGEFAGLVRIRRGEIADLTIGLAGIASPGGRSDVVFPIANDPFPGSPVRREAPVEASEGDTPALTIAVVLFATALAALLLGVGARRARRRRHPTTTVAGY